MDIVMPKMGESVNEGTIIKWYKKKGDKVKKDEIIFEISTDKVDTEIPSSEEGILTEILVGEQETVEVGTVVARITSAAAGDKELKENNSVPELKIKKDLLKAISADIPPKIIAGEKTDNDFNSAMPTEVKNEMGFLSPLVLSLANKENISLDELNKIKGTGLEGRISKKDMLLYIDNRKSNNTKIPVIETQNANEKQKESVSGNPDIEVIHMDNIRLKIMQHMINSRDTSVHVNALIEVDMGKIYYFIQNRKEEFLKNEGIKLTFMPFIADAIIKALKEFPLVNSTIEGTDIYKKKYINLGIAVAIEPNGLIVPNIKNAGEKNIIGLAKAISDIALRARTKKLTPDDITNGTFSITNYGVFGTIFGTPIINQPEVAILGVGAVIKKPIVLEVDGNDTIAIKPVMAITLAHDHRLIDGMLGSKFIKFVKETLENFNPLNL
jgi:2-oxoglutarate dehydrogenase E2 component (dihydrolipoamide succinyltransferase)